MTVHITFVSYRDVERIVVCYIVTAVTWRMCCFLLGDRLIVKSQHV